MSWILPLLDFIRVFVLFLLTFLFVVLLISVFIHSFFFLLAHSFFFVWTLFNWHIASYLVSINKNLPDLLTPWNQILVLHYFDDWDLRIFGEIVFLLGDFFIQVCEVSIEIVDFPFIRSSAEDVESCICVDFEADFGLVIHSDIYNDKIKSCASSWVLNHLIMIGRHFQHRQR